MNNVTPLEGRLLALGLEDLIALPEVPQVEEVRELPGGVTQPEIAEALIGLLRDGRIQVWSGRWPEDPEIVHADTAERFLQDRDQYEFNSAADLRERVYFVNIDNVQESLATE